MSPFLIFATTDAIRQGDSDLGVVALVAVVALGVVANRGFLTELVRPLLRLGVRTRNVDMDMRFKDTPPPPARR